MPREIRDGVQNFATLRENDLFYIDKTDFLRQWWLGAPDTSEVSLITRPRRFGKTLMLSTVEHFFSSKYAGRSDLFVCCIQSFCTLLICSILELVAASNKSS